MELLDTKTVKVNTQDGTEKCFIISKFPADPGLELAVEVACIAGGLAANKPDPAAMIATINKALAYAAVPGPNGDPIALTTAALRDNHIPDWEAKFALFVKLAQHNISFFRNGRASDSFSVLARILNQSNIGTSMASLAQSFKKGEQPSAN